MTQPPRYHWQVELDRLPETQHLGISFFSKSAGCSIGFGIIRATLTARTENPFDEIPLGVVNSAPLLSRGVGNWLSWDFMQTPADGGGFDVSVVLLARENGLTWGQPVGDTSNVDLETMVRAMSADYIYGVASHGAFAVANFFPVCDFSALLPD